VKNILSLFWLSIGLQLFPITLDAEIPGFENTVVLNASGESANEFVRSLFSQVGVPVKIESEIGGSVYGSFEGSASDVFAQISKTYNVHAYFNRQVAYVYRADDISEKLISMTNKKAQAIKKLVDDNGMTDARNTIYIVSGAGIEVVGNSRFVEKIEELANTLKVQGKYKKNESLKTTTYELDKKYIVREFKLKYASVVDKSQAISGHEVTIPGVASILRKFIDRNSLPTEIVTSAKKEEDRKKLNNWKNNSTAGSTSTSANPRIMAFPQTNSVWIEDTPNRIDIYASMIEAMDKAPRMVEIEATIIDINNSRQQELGINWRSIDGANQFTVGEGNNRGKTIRPNKLVNTAVEGGILSLVLGDRANFIARIRALEKLGAAKVVSTPHVITNSSMEAILGATTEVPIKLEGIEAVSLEEKSFGTVLRVTPRVLMDNNTEVIDLMISIEDGKASGRLFDNIPEIERSVVGTQTMITQGQSLLIGGLMRESTQETVSQVPILGRIPGIGRLFRSPSKEITKTERLFLITPRVVDGEEDGHSGPILRGAMKDIVATSDRRRDKARDQIDLKLKRHTEEVNGPSPFEAVSNSIKKAAQTEPDDPNSLVKTQLSDLLIVPELSETSGTAIRNSLGSEEGAVKGPWQVRNASNDTDKWQVISQ